MTTKKSIAESDYNGYETCERIRNYIEKQNLSADTPSINHCMTIVSPVKSYKGYLPSLGQLKMIYDYIDMLNYIFIEIGSTNIKMDTNYWWSSTEFPYGFAWCLSYGEIAHISKNNINNCNALPLFKKLN